MQAFGERILGSDAGSEVNSPPATTPENTDEIEQSLSLDTCYFLGRGRPRGQERSVRWELRRAA